MGNSIKDLIGEGYPLKTEKKLPPYKIYCDMDGVLTDFESRFEHFTGMSPKDYEAKHGRSPFWQLIDVTVGIKFWSEMEWMPNGLQLWSFIQSYKPDILTSPSRDNSSRLGKNLWVSKHISPNPKVIFSYSADKHRYANENSILIDDKESNIQEWAAKGGIAIRCENGNVNHVIEKLKVLGYE